MIVSQPPTFLVLAIRSRMGAVLDPVNFWKGVHSWRLPRNCRRRSELVSANILTVSGMYWLRRKKALSSINVRQLAGSSLHEVDDNCGHATRIDPA
ncbi:hypothetical protein [Nevskia sp.]|uniref:hypothetical protein n=1 Tax=Nevskia sp. TaxID=1929292 RepID=UPI003F6F8D4B